MIEFTDARGRIITVTARFKFATDTAAVSRDAEVSVADLINKGLAADKPMPFPRAQRKAIVLP